MDTFKVGDRELIFVSGTVGDYSTGTACAMSAAVALWRFKNGQPLGGATDNLSCVCDVIKETIIALNDSHTWATSEKRTQLLSPYIERILDTKDPSLIYTRALIAADYAVRKFAPASLRAYGLENHAEGLEQLTPVLDLPSAFAAQEFISAIVPRSDYLSLQWDQGDQWDSLSYAKIASLECLGDDFIYAGVTSVKSAEAAFKDMSRFKLDVSSIVDTALEMLDKMIEAKK